MASKKPRKSKRLTEDRENIERALMEETDRGCVLAVHGFIDGLLEGVIRTRLAASTTDPDSDTSKQLDWLLTGALAPLGSFTARLVFVRVMRLIDAKSFDALSELTSLRNHFAHYAGRVTLTNARVEGIERKLNPNSLFSIRERVSRGWFDFAIAQHGQSEARNRFTYIADELMLVAQLAKSAALKFGPVRGSYLSSRHPSDSG